MSTLQRETRFNAGIEVREAGEAKDGRIGTIAGYAAVFNSWSEDLGYFREIIRKGAFADSIKRDDIRALGHHDAMQIIGRTSAKTLELTEDEAGLKVAIAVPDTTAGRDLLVSLRRKDLTGMSFGFETVDDEWSQETVGGKRVYKRELKKVNLFEVSVVSWPAYSATSAEARSLLDQVAKDGIRRVGSTDVPSRRDLIVKRHRVLMGLWT